MKAFKTKNSSATACMLISVLLWALIPVFMHVGEGDATPFMFHAAFSLFALIGTFFVLLAFYPLELRNGKNWKIIVEKCKTQSFMHVILCNFNYIILCWSLKYINVSIASVLFETWPLWFVLFANNAFKNKNHYQKINGFNCVCLLMGFMGVVFVILSQSQINGIGRDGAGWVLAILGCLSALISGCMGALVISNSIKLGRDASDEIINNTPHFKKDLSIFFTLITMSIAAVPSIVIAGAAGLVWEKEAVEIDNMLIAAILGVFIVTFARLFLYAANLMTDKLQINAISYTTPLWTMTYLAILDEISTLKIDWLTMGVLGIITANIILNSNALKNLKIQYTLVGIWFFGVLFTNAII